MQIVVNGDFKREFKARILAGLAAASTQMRDAFRITVGVSANEGRRKYKRPSKSGAKTYTAYKAAATGGPPRMRTSHGKLSIRAAQASGRLAWQVGVIPIAGADKNYMLMLDAGISYPTRGPNKGGGQKLQWPWIEPTYNANLDACRQQFEAASR